MNAIIRQLEAQFIAESKAQFDAIADKPQDARFKGDDFRIGDTVDVHFRIVEGEKERIQLFHGVVIAMNGGGMNASFTVRRLVAGEGVERVFPLYAPRMEKVEIKRRGKAHRAKLYYLRDRVGKATRLREEDRPSRALPGKAKDSSAKAKAAVAEARVEAPVVEEAAPAETTAQE